MRVFALGQDAAGDDGVGAAVLRAVSLATEDFECRVLSDASTLVELLPGADPVIVVDAVLGEPPGQVVDLAPEELAGQAPLRVSSHGLGLVEALELAKILNDGTALPPIRIVAVTIARPPRWQQGLSPTVAAAVPRAAERVRELGRLFATSASAALTG